jgi:hypothetical protein
MMKSLRRWTLSADSPTSSLIAADARLSRTSFTDDQVWDVRLGAGDQPALALHTRYGGRAGLVSLVPLWTFEGRQVYQSMTYATPPTLTTILPDTITADCLPLPGLAVQFLFRAHESQVLGGQITLHNTTDAPLHGRFDWFLHIGVSGQEQKLTHISELGVPVALTTVLPVGNLTPVLLFDQGGPGDESLSPRLGINIALAADARITLRWLHVGLTSVQNSVALGAAWLKLDWKPYIDASFQAANALPSIETEDGAWDAVFMASSNRLMQSALKAAAHYPNPTFIAGRNPNQGYSPKGDGSDHPRSWRQDPFSAWLILPALAAIAPEIALGAFKNYLAIQAKQDGFIDALPGAGGQRLNVLSAPLLAQTAWALYEVSGNDGFVRDVLPGLRRFYDRWFTPERDVDGDGVPEWQDERQMGYVAFPTMAAAQPWGQGVDIRTIESPDLVTLLLLEGQALQHLAEAIKDKSQTNLTDRLSKLSSGLNLLWDGSRFRYQDRDTHESLMGRVLTKERGGDEELLLAEQFDPAARLLITVTGGANLVPRFTIVLEGRSENGASITERIDSSSYLWHNRRGVYTSQRVFSQIDRVRCEGLSRVYHVTVSVPDLSGLDINALMPLTAPNLTPEQQTALIRLATDPTHFWRSSGLTMVSALDPHYDGTNAKGGGGIWFYWLARVAEGLQKAGATKQAAALLRSVLALLTSVLSAEKSFYQFYTADAPAGSGETHHIHGIIPPMLITAAFGVQIASPSRVWVGGPFGWGKAITIEQHGVVVKRTTRKITIRFPSGQKVELPEGTSWQLVIDTQAAPIRAVTAPPPPPGGTVPPNSHSTEAPERIIIKVEREI